MDLKGKTVLVTGGAKRIGRFIAIAFARRGSDILLHYRSSAAEAEATRREILGLGAACELLQADLASKREIDALFRSHAGQLGTVTVLVNSASVFYPTPLETVNETHWREFIGSNLEGPFYLSQKIGLALAAARRSGLIVNITDWTTIARPYKDHVPYLASKAGLEMLTRALAVELAPHVRVNAVAPGAILFPESYTDKERDAVLRLIPLGREGKPEDIAEACVFMAEADYLNGITLAVDGGRSAGSLYRFG